ncbi:MAG: glycosyltransferase family 2 protein [Cyclobacteriaceae bacterium]|nr:glycosyltransferase family 2 protein [Cyclobacteriaceae bacterium]
MHTIALVTVLYKSEKVLEGFFRSLSLQSFQDYHLFLIDNSPSPACTALIHDFSLRYPISGFTHVENKENVGVAAGNNQGIKRSMEMGFTHSLLLNNDIEFHQPHLLQAMYDHAIQHHEMMIIPKIFYFDSRKIWMAGGWIRSQRGIVYHVGDGKEDGPEFNQPRYFTYAPTCFMLINNQVFQSVGLMDEKYFVYYDDTDFVYRASLRDYRILYLPTLQVLHKVSSSTGGGESTVSIYFNTRNRIYFLRKNFGVIKRITPMVYTLVTRLIRYFLYNREQRRKLMEGIRDGFAMKVEMSTQRP